MKRVCLITGANGTLGTALCQQLSAAYELVGVYRREPPAMSHQDSFTIDPRTWQNDAPVPDGMFAIQADLLRTEEVERTIELALARFRVIDVLVNAAADTRFHGSLTETRHKMDRYREQLSLNALTPMLIASTLFQKAWKNVPAENLRRNRNVVNISSVSGLRVFGGVGQATYAASKSALNMLSRHLATEVGAYNVRVNALCPSGFPSTVSTAQVVNAVLAFADGKTSGQVVHLDQSGEHQT